MKELLTGSLIQFSTVHPCVFLSAANIVVGLQMEISFEINPAYLHDVMYLRWLFINVHYPHQINKKIKIITTLKQYMYIKWKCMTEKYICSFFVFFCACQWHSPLGQTLLVDHPVGSEWRWWVHWTGQVAADWAHQLWRPPVQEWRTANRSI